MQPERCAATSKNGKSCGTLPVAILHAQGGRHDANRCVMSLDTLVALLDDTAAPRARAEERR